MLYIIFLVVFIIFLTVFAYIGTRSGLVGSLMSLLRIVVPMVLSGIIVQLAIVISNNDQIIKHIVGGIGAVIFFFVLKDKIAVKPGEKTKNLTIIDYFLGFLIGAAQGWLLAGFVLEYLNVFHFFQLFNISDISKVIVPATFYHAIINPVQWLLFLSFIRF